MINQELIIKSTILIREAMKSLDIVIPKILFAVENNRLLGTVTDGDIRRYLLSGGNINDEIINAANKKPKVAKDIEEAKKLYNQKTIVAVPIINSNNQLLDIYIGNKEIEYKAFNIPIVINAGGKGTRLDPYTRVLPKPLIPVGELPIIEHIMQQYKKYSCDNFSVIINYKKQLIKSYFAESENKYNITFYDENNPLGTGGGLSLLRNKLKETFFFTNCDILITANYESALRFHKENKNVITMICAYKNLTIPYGVIEMEKNGEILSMKEKPEYSFLTNTGMYICEPEILEDIKDNVPIGFPDVVDIQRKKGKKVAIYPVSENEWMDMGQLDELEKMRVKLYGK